MLPEWSAREAVHGRQRRRGREMPSESEGRRARRVQRQRAVPSEWGETQPRLAEAEREAQAPVPRRPRGLPTLPAGH